MGGLGSNAQPMRERVVFEARAAAGRGRERYLNPSGFSLRLPARPFKMCDGRAVWAGWCRTRPALPKCRHRHELHYAPPHETLVDQPDHAVQVQVGDAAVTYGHGPQKPSTARKSSMPTPSPLTSHGTPT